MKVTLEAGEHLIRDYWPVEVAHGARSYREARVYVTSRRVLAVAMKLGRPTVVVEEYRPTGSDALLHSPGTPGGRSMIPVDDGTTVYVSATRGCGCGSPLAGLPVPRAR